MSSFLTFQKNFSCDKCGRGMPLNAEMFGCRNCNHDLCKPCALIPSPQKRASAPTVMQRPASDAPTRRTSAPGMQSSAPDVPTNGPSVPDIPQSSTTPTRQQQQPDVVQRTDKRKVSLGLSTPRRLGGQVLEVPGHTFDLEKPDTETKVTEHALKMFQAMDIDQHGTLNKNEFIAALQRNVSLEEFVFPGIDLSDVNKNEEIYDAVTEKFKMIAQGKKRFSKEDFIAFCEKETLKGSHVTEIQKLFEDLDADGNGLISRLELVGALQRNARAADVLLWELQLQPSREGDEHVDLVDSVFEAIAGGKKRIEFADFETFIRIHKASTVDAFPHNDMERANKRLLIIGPGFGREMNPKQSALVVQAGYQIQWVLNIPNPEQPGVQMMQHLGKVIETIQEFQPHIVMAASKGTHYLIALWRHGYWKGPSVLINAHPDLIQLPPNVPIVVCQGSNDETYPRDRTELEELIQTGSPNRCMLYWTGDSGQLAPGQYTRRGDTHNQASLQLYDTLPRLIDATMSAKGPEMHIMWSWQDRLSEDRRAAEQWLGYSPDQLHRTWDACKKRSMDDQKLYDVPRDSREWRVVSSIFLATPKEPPAYITQNAETWPSTKILKIQRIENMMQEAASFRPHYEALKRSIEQQGVAFEPGVHTCWSFHGTEAIDSIVNDPIQGFQPLAAGTRKATLWGAGTYFARDARYAADGGFCLPKPDGTRQILMCLLNRGMCCLGNPGHKGVLPFRNKPHRYHSTVDSLSNPEVFIIQHPGAAYPAYLMTFLR